MTKSSQVLYLAVIAIGTFTSITDSQSEELLSLTPGITKSVIVNGADAGRFTSIIGDPKIADVTFGPKNTLWFIGRVEGTTNFIMADNDTGLEMYSTIIVVENINSHTNLVNIHNRKQLESHATYRCNPLCLYLREHTSKEPVALPAGHVVSHSTYTGLATAPTPTQPAGAP